MAYAIEASLRAERLAREAAAAAAAAAPAPAPAPAPAASGASSPLGEPMDWSPLGSHPLDLEPTSEPSPAPSPRTPRTARRRPEKGALRSRLCLRCARAALASNAGDASRCYNNNSGGICCYKCAFGHNYKPLSAGAKQLRLRLTRAIDSLSQGRRGAKAEAKAAGAALRGLLVVEREKREEIEEDAPVDNGAKDARGER
ncbi:hypothetical protein E8E12_005086 [Didymella heteroderae]|uniref:Uncharacterized protein n=1 Tax=Didymella heteroderae TaxID=1769908 RepID=A0A9P4WXE3_9PLEO|nr:hypothetical protein E8E12_005086 [Didymella heteroderae]